MLFPLQQQQAQSGGLLDPNLMGGAAPMVSPLAQPPMQAPQQAQSPPMQATQAQQAAIPAEGPGLRDYIDNMMNSPLAHMGIGLLAADGRAEGLAKGLQSWQQQQQSTLRARTEKLRHQTIAQKAKLERERAEKAEAREARQEAAKRRFIGLIAGDDEQKARLGGALLESGAPLPFTVGLLNPSAETTSAMREYAFAVQQGETRSFADWLIMLKQAGRSVSNVNVGLGGYKPLTEAGKLAADREYFRTQPDTPENRKIIDALSRDLAAVGTGAEQQRSEGKIEAAADAADDFNEVADAAGTATGPIRGRGTLAQTGSDLASGLVKSVAPPSEEQARLRAMEAQMTTQLGTALSGAAIPESEWPKYRAQLPSITDTRAERIAKAKELRSLLKKLKRIKDQRDRAAGPGGDGFSSEILAPENSATGAPVRSWNELPRGK